jgi:adenine-specific DNA-methyltransferase
MHSIIQRKSLSSIDTVLEEKLLNSVISYFEHENYKLGLGIADYQINQICKVLLYRNDDASIDFPVWHVGEKTILDEYRKEEIEIVDYLHLISIELRKQLGQYATPADIVRYILRSIKFIPSEDIITKRLIDPACGSGAFLLESARIYLNALKKAKIPIHKWYPLVSSAISGIDIDPTACFFTRLNLAILLAPAVLEFVAKNGIKKLKPLSVYCSDTLQLFASEKEGAALFYNKLNLSLENQFDFVVGNPPYFKIKGMNDDLKNIFSRSIYGHPNAYGLFIHAGIEMLKKDGKLGFIVPRSMLSGLYFKKLREFIEGKTSVKEIVYISERKKIFENVLHGTMLLSLERNRDSEKTVNISFIQSLKEIGTQSSISVDRDKVIQSLNGTTIWFVADSQEMYNIINRIIKEHPLLSGQEINCKAKTGQIVWNRVKSLLNTNSSQNTLPLIWATDVGKFGFSFNRMGTARPCYLKVNSKTENLIVKGSSILIQRVTADEQHSRIVACMPEEFYKKECNGYFVENHLNIIQPIKEESSINLYFILGILNSEIIEFFFRAMSGNTQVSATELNLLPIPIGRYEHEISSIADMIQKTIDDKKKNKLLTELNLLVAKAYGLSADELEFIRRSLSQRRRRDNWRN